MMQQNPSEFGKWRSLLWPIHGYELKKVLPLLIMFTLITFNYTLLRDTKDTLVITAPGSGAEIIPFLKVWGVVPAAILLALLYAKLSNILSRRALFYVTITPFLFFFALFAFVLYPMRDILHPTELADRLQALLPPGFGGLIALFRNWTFALFYVLAELWGSIILTLTFWGFANQITKVSEATRFYTLMGIGGNSSPFFAGSVMVYVSSLASIHWGEALESLMLMVVAAGVLICGCYEWIRRFVMKDERLFKEPDPQKTKLKMSLKESILYLAKSKYIGSLALLVIAYGVAMNLIDVTWKHQVKLQYPNPTDYSNFMGHFSMYTGIVSCFMALFVAGNLLRRFGWSFAAQVTPFVLLITGIFFFALVLFSDQFSPLLALLGLTPLMGSVLVGAVQNIMSKCTKYALFDTTKEIAYIPLDEESKVKGKAAVDVVGSRLGKSGGALIQQGLLVTLGSISAMTPYVAVLLFAVIFVWILGARLLGKQFAQLSGEETPKQPVEDTTPDRVAP